MTDARERVLLVSLSNWTGLSRLPAVFSRAGFRVVVAAPARFLISRSGYADDVVNMPEDPAHFLAALRDFMGRHGGDFRFGLVCDDNLLYVLNPHRHEPWLAPLLPAAPDALAFLLSKRTFPVVCHRHGLPVPPFAIAADRDLLREQAGKLGFPCILKRTAGFAGLAVQAVPDAATLQQQLAAIPASEAVLLQAFIQGRVGGVSAVWVRGRLKSWFAFLKVQCWPTPFSPACIIRLVERPGLRAVLEKLGEVSGFNGLGGIDFMEQPDGRIVLLEQHARPTPTFIYAERAGIDLSRALRALAHGEIDAPLQSPVIRDFRPLPLFPQEAFRMIDLDRNRRMTRWLVVERYREQLFTDDAPLFAETLRLLQGRAARRRAGVRPGSADGDSA